MGVRVNNGPDDNPDESYVECDDCGGTGEVHIPVLEGGAEVEGLTEPVSCPGCDGLGFIEGD